MRACRAIDPRAGVTVISLMRERFVRRTAEVARVRLNDVTGGQPTVYETYVDGARSASIEAVHFGGAIRFVFAGADVGPALDWIWHELVTRSPIGPERGLPHYFQVHWLFVDSERIEVPEGANALQIAPRSHVMFVNARPYARRLEHGWSMQAPDGVYEVVAIEARREFPNLAIEFEYLNQSDVPGTIPWPVKSWYGFPSIKVALV